MNYQDFFYKSATWTSHSYVWNVFRQSASWCLGFLETIQNTDHCDHYQPIKQDIRALFLQLMIHEVLPLLALNLINNSTNALIGYLSAALIYPYVLYKGFFICLKALFIGNPIKHSEKLVKEKKVFSPEIMLTKSLRDPIADTLSVIAQTFLYYCCYNSPTFYNLPVHLFAAYSMGTYLLRAAVANPPSNSSYALAFGLIHQFLIMGLVSPLLKQITGTSLFITHYTLSLLLIPLEIKIIANSPLKLKKGHSALDVFFYYEATIGCVAKILILGSVALLIHALAQHPMPLKTLFYFLNAVLKTDLMDDKEMKTQPLTSYIRPFYQIIKHAQQELNQLQSLQQSKISQHATLLLGIKWLKDYNPKLSAAQKLPVIGSGVQSLAKTSFSFWQNCSSLFPTLLLKVNTMDEFQALLDTFLKFLKNNYPSTNICHQKKVEETPKAPPSKVPLNTSEEPKMMPVPKKAAQRVGQTTQSGDPPSIVEMRPIRHDLLSKR